MLGPFRRRTDKARAARRLPPGNGADEHRALDPVALALAVWLGLVTAVTGLAHLSQNAVALSLAAQARQRAQPAGTRMATVLARPAWD